MRHGNVDRQGFTKRLTHKGQRSNLKHLVVLVVLLLVLWVLSVVFLVFSVFLVFLVLLVAGWWLVGDDMSFEKCLYNLKEPTNTKRKRSRHWGRYLKGRGLEARHYSEFTMFVEKRKLHGERSASHTTSDVSYVGQEKPRLRSPSHVAHFIYCCIFMGFESECPSD